MDPKTIKMRLQELAFLNSKATIWYKAASGKEASANGNGAVPAEDDGWEKLHYSGGLQEYVRHLNKDNSAMHEPIFIQEEVQSITTLHFCLDLQNGELARMVSLSSMLLHQMVSAAPLRIFEARAI